jgi:hypothetical protein
MSKNLPSDPVDVWSRYINNLPFSGPVDVSQRFMQNMGFINIYNLKTGEDQKGAEIEKQITNDVASYGRQLGWIIEVLNIIADRYELKNLTDEEYTSMDQFFDLSKKTEDIKHKINQNEGIKQKPEHQMLTSGQLNLMIEGIHAWEKIDKNKFNEMVSRIKSAFP